MPITVKQLGDISLEKAVDRTLERISEINLTKTYISKGKGIMAESRNRLMEFDKRQKTLAGEELVFSYKSDKLLSNYESSTIFEKPPGVINPTRNIIKTETDIGFERKIGDINDILSIEFLEAGLLAAKSVGRITSWGEKYGTGFLVGKQIMITNHHIIQSHEEAENSIFELNVEENKLGTPKKIYEYSLNPARFFLTNKTLDFTLVAVTDSNSLNPDLEGFGWHALLKIQGKIRKGDSINIIQHPDGQDKKIVVHNSYLLHLEDNKKYDQYCWYSGDTEQGSSGSPVFNNRWEIIALHHKAIPKTNKKKQIVDVNGHVMSEKRAKENPKNIDWFANEGIRISRIVETIEKENIQSNSQKNIRNELLALWNAPMAHKKGLKAADKN